MRLYNKPASWQHVSPAPGLRPRPVSRPAQRANPRRLEPYTHPESEQALAERAREDSVRQLADAIARWGVSAGLTIDTPTADETTEKLGRVRVL